MAINTAIGSETSVSYVDIEEADAYLGSNLDSDQWFLLQEHQKEYALKVATKMIDNFTYAGTQRNYIQALAFPRTGVYRSQNANLPVPSDTIPQAIKDAQIETALWLILSHGLDDFQSVNLTGMSLTKAPSRGGSEQEFPEIVYILVKPYLKASINSSVISVVRGTASQTSVDVSSTALGTPTGTGTTPSTENFYTFTRLNDTPDSYAGNSLKALRVKQDESGIDFYVPANTGWGSITGTLSEQEDINNALVARSLTTHRHAGEDIIPNSVITPDIVVQDTFAAGGFAIDDETPPYSFRLYSSGRINIGTSADSTAKLVIKSDTNAPVYTSELYDGTGWTMTGWAGSFATGFLNSGGNTAALSNAALAPSINELYQLALTITLRTTGSITVGFAGYSFTGVTATSKYGVNAETAGYLTITPTSDFNGNVKISLKRITTPINPVVDIRVDNTYAGVAITQSSSMFNTTVGKGAGSLITSGTENTAHGAFSQYNTTSGTDNTSVGADSLYDNTSGSNNTAVGSGALRSTASGSNNTAVGSETLRDVANLTGTGGNTAVGYNTGRGITTGTNNTIIGANVTGLSSSLSNTVIIADGAGTRRINVNPYGGVSIGIDSAVTSAILDLTSTTKGFLGPRMTTAQRDALTSPVAGLLIYNSTTNAFNVHNGTSWVALGTTGAVSWGSISGTLSAQTDLNTALSGKASTTHDHNATYAGISHNHDADYSNITHNHSTAYSDISHNHDTDYADILHDHDSDYEAKLSNPDVDGKVLSSTAAGVRSWITAGSGGVSDWGDITGTLSDQTDLQSALNAKEDDLGNPSTNGLVLASTTAGVRSWVSAPAGTATWGAVTGTLADQTDLNTALTTLQGNIDDKEDDLGNPDTNGKVLSSTTAGVRSWITPASSAAWGNITGTLADQTDLNTALSGKAASSHNHDTAYADIATEHTHTNKTLLDNIISSGDGNSYLANDGTYKGISANGSFPFDVSSSAVNVTSGYSMSHTGSRLFEIYSTTTAGTVTMPVAQYLDAEGLYCILYNSGGFDIKIRNYGAALIDIIRPGQIKFMYLFDDSTDAGRWVSTTEWSQNKSAVTFGADNVIATGSGVGLNYMRVYSWPPVSGSTYHLCIYTSTTNIYARCFQTDSNGDFVAIGSEVTVASAAYASAGKIAGYCDGTTGGTQAALIGFDGSNSKFKLVEITRPSGTALSVGSWAEPVAATCTIMDVAPYGNGTIYGRIVYVYNSNTYTALVTAAASPTIISNQLLIRASAVTRAECIETDTDQCIVILHASTTMEQVAVAGSTTLSINRALSYLFETGYNTGGTILSISRKSNTEFFMLVNNTATGLEIYQCTNTTTYFTIDNVVYTGYVTQGNTYSTCIRYLPGPDKVMILHTGGYTSTPFHKDSRRAYALILSKYGDKYLWDGATNIISDGVIDYPTGIWATVVYDTAPTTKLWVIKDNKYTNVNIKQLEIGR